MSSGESDTQVSTVGSVATLPRGQTAGAVRYVTGGTPGLYVHNGTAWAILNSETTPEAYGAVGDGVANDAAAIQAAIDAIPSTGGTVYCARIYGLGAAGLAITSWPD